MLALLSGGADSTLLVVLLAELGHAPRACTWRTACAAPTPTPTTTPAAPLRAARRAARRRRRPRRRPARTWRRGCATSAAAAALARAGAAPDRHRPHRDRPRGDGALPPRDVRRRARPARPAAPRGALGPAAARPHARRGARRAAPRGVPWRDDASNDDRGPARNRIRHDVLPVLRSLNPAAEANVARAGALRRTSASCSTGSPPTSWRPTAASTSPPARGPSGAAAPGPARRRRPGRRSLGHLDVEALRGMPLVGTGAAHACRAPPSPSAVAPGCPSHPRQTGGRPRDRPRRPRVRDASRRGHDPGADRRAGRRDPARLRRPRAARGAAC